MSNKNYNNYSKKPENKTADVNTVTVETAPEASVVTPEPEVAEPIMGVVSGCEKLNVRENPSLKAKVVCIINEDDVVEIVNGEMTNGWYSVVTEAGAEGYCMAQFITLN